MIPGLGGAVPPQALPGFAAENWAEAFASFRVSALALLDGTMSLRPAQAVPDALEAVSAAAARMPASLSPSAARDFFLDHFVAHTVSNEAFFTGYYEPVVDGSLARGPGFRAPLLARPDDLRTLAAGEPRPDWAAALAAVRSRPDGTLAPYPERAAIEAEAERGGGRPLVWLRDWVEVFLIHVQGSARVRLPDGSTLRLTYAGRNGHPYTSIGRLLVESGAIASAEMSLARLKAWLRENGQEPGQPGRTLMQRNASYIFFDASPARTSEGPTGGAGVPLTALRSIAIDRTRWCYGLPFWIDADLPDGCGGLLPFRQLTIAQDTGSAIVGPARVDLFCGTGEAAGHRAGDIRHRGCLAVLLPRGSRP